MNQRYAYEAHTASRTSLEQARGQLQRDLQVVHDAQVLGRVKWGEDQAKGQKAYSTGISWLPRQNMRTQAIVFLPMPLNLQARRHVSSMSLHLVTA